MILAVLLLLLALLGVLPFSVALPLATASLVVGATGVWLLSRRLRQLPIRTGQEAMLGATATALTPIDPIGQVRYGSEIWNAKTEGQPIQVGKPVKIIRLAGLRAIVRQLDSDGGSQSDGC